jgi:pilus assembly protein Flp/PilA
MPKVMDLIKARVSDCRGLHTRDDRGATAVEYALMVTLIALVIIAAVTAFGLSVSGLFHLVNTTAPFN